ncbi:hypothetical protein HA402_008175 [Bradysia odoriphaga]|nr:hypothetical protein HA402_008175 [Bradysia odoriphaga]
MLQKSPRLLKVLNGQQQDAHEFLKLFINEMTYYQHPESELAPYFTADICTEVTCQTCQTIFKNKSSIADFIVNIQRTRTVDEAFHSFFEIETIDYNCIVCMKSVLATKKCVLASLPECLCIILNRISKQQTKINKNIEISHQLSVECVSENIVRTCKYGLVAVSSHIGGSYNGGHYTTSVKTNNNIYKFDDSKVRKQHSISGLHAYILFYEPIEGSAYGPKDAVANEFTKNENEWTRVQNNDQCMRDVNEDGCFVTSVDCQYIENEVLLEHNYSRHPLQGSAYGPKDAVANEFTENENEWTRVQNDDQCMRDVNEKGCFVTSVDCQYIENEVLLEHNYSRHPLQDQTSRYMENEVKNNDAKEKTNLTDIHIEDISIGVRMAAKYWNECDISLGEKCRNLEKDCMNAFLHCLDVHDGCAQYFCSKTTSPGARDRLALLKSGKRVNNALARSYKSRTAMAGVHLNSGYRAGSTFQQFKYGKVLPEMIKMENKRKRKVVLTAISKQKNPKKRRVQDDEGGKKKKKAYGEGHQDVDMTPAQYETAKTIFLDRINEDQSNRLRIELQTQDKRYSDKYCQIMQDLLTSSYFSRVLHARNRKSYKKIVEDILYHNILYSNTADLVHQRLYEQEALELFSSLYKSESIDVCGVFIDAQFSFLAASPFRLFGRDGIVVLKCPLNVFKKSINDAIQRNLIPFWSKSKESDAVVVNVNSHWHAEIQGELHVCRKKYAYLMVYLGSSEFKIEKIERDDEYWRTKMEAELVYFYNEAMLKELVDSRDSRDMELREYDEKTETFI